MQFGKGLLLIFLTGCCDMSFTLPVGNFQPPATGVVRPSSVVDTVSGGTITNSSNAYDGDKSTYAYYKTVTSGGAPESTFSFATVVTVTGKTIYYNFDCDSTSSTITAWVSTDNGSTFPLVVQFIMNPSPFVTPPDSVNRTISINLPASTLLTAVKTRVLVTTSVGGDSHIRLYDIYIQ